MYSIPTTQPTVDLSSYVEQRGIIVVVQWFGTKVAVEAVVCFQFHGVDRVGRVLFSFLPQGFVFFQELKLSTKIQKRHPRTLWKVIYRYGEQVYRTTAVGYHYRVNKIELKLRRRMATREKVQPIYLNLRSREKVKIKKIK